MKKWLSRQTYFIEILNTKIVGVVGCFMEFGNCKLIHMAIIKEFRRKNIDSILLDRVEDFAIKNKAYKIWLDTSTRLKESIEFYNSRGF